MGGGLDENQKLGTIDGGPDLPKSAAVV